MAEARALDEKIARGEKVGALAGLPLGVKDLEDTVGLVTSHGSKPFKDNVAKTDSIQVARLKAAGAIVIGKTNAPEFGYTAFTKNLLFGPTRNPWNLERTPGGSSGGTSAAIAGGVVPISTGSDGGGSVRIPACYTGCYGLKPNYGRIPNDPTLGMQAMERHVGARADRAHGARRRDLHGRGSRLSSRRSRLDAASGDFLRAILEGLPKKLRIAFHPDFGQLVQTDVAREIAKAAAVFKDLGHSVTTIDDPVPDTGRAWMQVGAGQGYAMLHEMAGQASRRLRARVRHRHRSRGSRHVEAYGRGVSASDASSTIGASGCSSASICCYARCCRPRRFPRRVRCRPRSTASRSSIAGRGRVHLSVQHERASGSVGARGPDGFRSAMRIANRRRASSRGPGAAGVVRVRTGAAMEQQVARDLRRILIHSGPLPTMGRGYRLGATSRGCRREQSLRGTLA